MASTQNKLVSEAAAAARRILMICSELAGEKALPIQDVPVATSLLQARKCLQCKRDVTSAENYRRGLCSSCYQATRRAIDASPSLEREMIAEGILATATKGGRPRLASHDRTALDEFLAHHLSPQQLAAHMLEHATQEQQDTAPTAGKQAPKRGKR